MSLGLVHTEHGRYQEAAGEFRKTLKLNPNYGEACLRLGTLLIELKDYDGALQSLRRAVQLMPEDLDSRFHLGRVYALTGRPADAEAQLSEILRLRPDHPDSNAIRAEIDRLRQQARGQAP